MIRVQTKPAPAPLQPAAQRPRIQSNAPCGLCGWVRKTAGRVIEAARRR